MADEVTRVINEVQPDVVVTLDGSDGHRDHQAIRDATLAAVERASRSGYPAEQRAGPERPGPQGRERASVERTQHRPARTYLMCLARSSMTRWVEHMRALDMNADYTEMGDLGTPDADITTIIDVREHIRVRWAAIRAHRSQVSPFESLPPELQDEFLATDRLQRVDPPWRGGSVESDLFA